MREKLRSAILCLYVLGLFSILNNKKIEQAGMVTDAVWNDFNNDGYDDLILVGEWMSPKFFINQNGVLEEVNVLDKNLNGLWQSIAPFDIDHDGARKLGVEFKV